MHSSPLPTDPGCFIPDGLGSGPLGGFSVNRPLSEFIKCIHDHLNFFPLITSNWSRELNELFPKEIAKEITDLIKEYGQCKLVRVDSIDLPDCRSLGGIATFYQQKAYHQVNSMGVGHGLNVFTEFRPVLHEPYYFKKKEEPYYLKGVYDNQWMGFQGVHQGHFLNSHRKRKWGPKPTKDALYRVPKMTDHINQNERIHSPMKDKNEIDMEMNLSIPLFQHDHIEKIKCIRMTVTEKNYLCGVP